MRGVIIWFVCENCGKKHGRPESSSGSLVFCDCGQGNTVPWESTTEPEVVVVTELLPPAPELAPVRFPVEKSSAPPVRLPSRPSDREDDRAGRPRRPASFPPRPRPRQRDPNICLNHPTVISQAICVDCKNGFCQDCLIQLGGEPVCAACKNQRVKALSKAAPMSQLALVSLLLALVTGPLAFCLYPLGRSFSSQTLSAWALIPQLASLGLGVWALAVTEKNRRLGGKALAISAIVTASFAALWSLFLTFYAARLMGS
jgi:hypothetical protein